MFGHLPQEAGCHGRAAAAHKPPPKGTQQVQTSLGPSEPYVTQTALPVGPQITILKSRRLLEYHYRPVTWFAIPLLEKAW